MRTNSRFRVYLGRVFLMGLFLATVCFMPQEAGATPPPSCLMSLTVDRNANPWDGMTGSFEEEQASKSITASRSHWKKLGIPAVLEKYRVGGEPLLGIDKEHHRVIVNGRIFGNLHRADATRVTPGKPQTVGKVLQLNALPTRTLALFLLESQIIQTYWHLDSKLCLSNEEDGKELYSATFTGTHSYCTNECLEAPLNFVIRIDKKSGEMSLSSAN